MTAFAPIDEMSDAEFRRIVEIAAEDAGLAIPPSKKSLVQSRVTRRMREIGVSGCKSYLQRLDTDSAERGELICVLTTNVSHFYREDHHFTFIRDRILSRPDPRGLRFWSAGCSNGQEAYTLAFEILQAIPDAASRDILVLASDIDPKVLEKARSGTYHGTEIEGIPAAVRPKFLTPSGSMFKVLPDIAALVRFRQLNLNSDWPMRGKFDLIMCRNVVIYFNDQTQAALWPRFADRLKPDGFLMLGHSERIHPLDGSGFESVGVTTYRKL